MGSNVNDTGSHSWVLPNRWILILHKDHTGLRIGGNNKMRAMVMIRGGSLRAGVERGAQILDVVFKVGEKRFLPSCGV